MKKLEFEQIEFFFQAGKITKYFYKIAYYLYTIYLVFISLSSIISISFYNLLPNIQKIDVKPKYISHCIKHNKINYKLMNTPIKN